MVPDTAPSQPLSLQAYVQILRRRRRLILLVAMLTAAFGALPALVDDPVYTSSARIQLSALDQEGIFRDETAASLPSDWARELATEIEILRSARVRSAVTTHLQGQGQGQAPDYMALDVEQIGSSEVVKITITASTPGAAAEVANAYADVFVEDRRARSVEALDAKADELRGQSADVTRELDAVVERLADPALPPGERVSAQLRQASLVQQVQDLDQRADELDVEAALRGRATQVISPAELRNDPIEESPVRDGGLGLVLGLLLGVTIAVIADTVQDRLGSREDLADVRPNVPLLASVPHADFGDAGRVGGFAVQEAYRYLRTGIRVFGLNATLRSALVASAIGGEGKTTTAANLARTMADAGDHVVLIDCDLRRPSLHQQFGLPNDVGLSSVVVGDACLEDALQFVRPNLVILTAGPSVMNPTEMLGSEQFALSVQAIVDQFDFTIADSPPVLPVADALIAGQQFDGVIVVSRIGEVRRRSVRELLRRLDEARIMIIGLVANAVTDGDREDYYDPTRRGPRTLRHEHRRKKPSRL